MDASAKGMPMAKEAKLFLTTFGVRDKCDLILYSSHLKTG